MRALPFLAAGLLLATACGDSGADGGRDRDGGVDPEVDGGTAQSSIDDPAPGLDEPGEYGCDGCPDSDVTVFELEPGAVTSLPFVGTVTGADGNGVFWVGGPDGQALGGPIATAADGTYSFTAPLFCGEQLVKCVWSNEVGSYTIVSSVVTTDCVDADIRVTISWDELGDDWELHLIKPGGTINDNATDCTWTSCIGTGPDWGVPEDPSDDPRKDVDDTDAYGPENIFLAGPEAGTYTVMVEHWGPGEPSDGQAIFNVAGRALVVPMTGLVSQHVWTAARIEWPSGEVTPSDEVIDCTADWSGGCRQAIP